MKKLDKANISFRFYKMMESKSNITMNNICIQRISRIISNIL